MFVCPEDHDCDFFKASRKYFISGSSFYYKVDLKNSKEK